jgi:hypothetical protein
MSVPQSQIRVDSIEGQDPVGPVLVSYGASVPSGQIFEVSGGVNVSGTLTCANSSPTDLNIPGSIAAGSFEGDGSQLTNLPVVNNSKTIAITFIR